MLFRLSDDGTYGRFEYGADTEALHDAYYDVAEHLAEGRLDEWEAIERYEALAARPYGVVHGNEGLGGLYAQRGDHRAARACYDAAVREGDRYIPKGYRGEIIWGEFDNRPYLRALHGAALSRLDLGHGRAAADRLRRLIRCNPSDNTGARFLLGEALVWADDFDAAERALRAVLDGEDHPPTQYLLGLVYVALGQHVQAATAFRRGLVGNVYVAQFVLERRPIAPYAIGVYNGGYGGPDTASDHYGRSRELYRRQPRAVALLDALYRDPAVAAHVEDVLLLRADHARVKGVSEKAISRRLLIQAEIEAEINLVTDESSEAIVTDLDA